MSLNKETTALIVVDAIDAVVALSRGEDLGGASVDTGVSTVDASNVAEYK